MGIQYCAVHLHCDRRIHHWIDLRLQDRFGRHGCVIPTSNVFLLISYLHIACIPFVLSSGFIRLVSLVLLGLLSS